MQLLRSCSCQRFVVSCEQRFIFSALLSVVWGESVWVVCVRIATLAPASQSQSPLTSLSTWTRLSVDECSACMRAASRLPYQPQSWHAPLHSLSTWPGRAKQLCKFVGQRFTRFHQKLPNADDDTSTPWQSPILHPLATKVYLVPHPTRTFLASTRISLASAYQFWLHEPNDQSAGFPGPWWRFWVWIYCALTGAAA